MKKLILGSTLLTVAACASVDYSDDGIKSRVQLADRECSIIGYPAEDRIDCTHIGYRQITGAAIADAQAANGRSTAVVNTVVAIGAAGGI